MNINEKITQAQATIKEAEKKLAIAKKQAEDICSAEKKDSATFLYELEQKYKYLAIELAEDEAPVSRWKVPLQPDDVEVTPEGIKLTWSDDYSFKQHTVTWEELFEAEKESE